MAGYPIMLAVTNLQGGIPMIGIYARVSSKAQDTASQELDLGRWSDGKAVAWYRDKATGTNFVRSDLQRLERDIAAGIVKTVVIWRLDRLGRSVREMLAFFDFLKLHGCNFVSLRDSIDLSTPSGRLMLVVLAGVAAFETEVRSERQRAGIDVAQEEIASGKRKWFLNGTPNRKPRKLTPEIVTAAKEMRQAGKPIAEIGRVLKLPRKTIYVALGK